MPYISIFATLTYGFAKSIPTVTTSANLFVVKYGRGVKAFCLTREPLYIEIWTLARNVILLLFCSPELTKLWECSNNIEACKSTNREFLPPLKDFFEESIEQEDPKNEIEDEYKYVM